MYREPVCCMMSEGRTILFTRSALQEGSDRLRCTLDSDEQTLYYRRLALGRLAAIRSCAVSGFVVVASFCGMLYE